MIQLDPVLLKGSEFQMNKELDPFSQELYLFRWLENNLPKNNKKMVSLLKRIFPQCPTYMQKNFFHSAMVKFSGDPLKYVKESIKYSYEFPRVMKELMDDGNHGMIFNGDEVHGVMIKTRPNWLRSKDGKWDPAQEEEIAHELMKEWLITNRLRSWLGRIVLFADFGFSGLTMETEWLIPQDEWNQLQEIWKKEDSEKDTREIAELMAQL